VKIWDVATGREVLCLPGNTGSVFDVVFSRDGSRVAAAGTDRTVRLWDTATGQQTHVLQQRNWGRAATFSPDGRRVASGGVDGTVKLWDADTGQELLTLKGHTYPVNKVAFSRDGRKLASASSDGTAKIWDANDLTPERRIEYEARGLVEWLLAKPLPPEAVADAVRKDPTITEPVRQQALAWVQPCWRNRIRAEAARVVVPLFAKGLFRSEVVDGIKADTTLSQPLRQEALTLAESYPENAEALLKASLPVLSHFGAGAASYQLALRQAEAAYRLAPHDAVYVHAFGVAQYHVGKYQDALEKLTLAEKLGGNRFQPYYPCNLKFLALAHHQLGRKAEAQAALDRLRQSMQTAEPARLAVVQRYVRETEAVLNTNPAAGKGP
jgi:hypothetical protein